MNTTLYLRHCTVILPVGYKTKQQNTLDIIEGMHKRFEKDAELTSIINQILASYEPVGVMFFPF